jgi:hypothetical protein
VFLFRYGKKIFDKIKDKMVPPEDELLAEDFEPMNPYDLWEGANFKMSIRQVDGFRNYDKSEFMKPAPLDKEDGKLEEIWKSEHSLEAFIAPDQFKSYDELKDKMNKVLGLTGGVAKPFADALPEAPAKEIESIEIDEDALLAALGEE